jgi:hypothetical protein
MNRFTAKLAGGLRDLDHRFGVRRLDGAEFGCWRRFDTRDPPTGEADIWALLWACRQYKGWRCRLNSDSNLDRVLWVCDCGAKTDT